MINDTEKNLGAAIADKEDVMVTNNAFTDGLLNGGNETSSWTLAAWVKPNGAQRDEAMILGRFNCNSGLVGEYSHYHFRIRTNDAECTVGSVSLTYTPPDMKSWYHLVAVYNNRAMSFYANGVLVDSGTFSATMKSHTNTLYIGGSDANFSFKGSVDDVRIYNRALSAAEIKQLYNMGK